MIYTFLVIDFDKTYDIEDEDEIGTAPSVYMIDAANSKEVEKYAYDAGQKFHCDGSMHDMCIGEIFEALLKNAGIYFRFLCSLPLTFAERQADYLAQYIPLVIV